MSNTVIYTLMESLISKKYYATKEEAALKLGIYIAFNMLTNEQMTELMLLAEGVYAPPVEPTPEPENPETPTV